jgi:hypothetical protein
MNVKVYRKGRTMRKKEPKRKGRSFFGLEDRKRKTKSNVEMIYSGSFIVK